MARLELKIRELSEEWFSDLGRATIYRAPVVGALGGFGCSFIRFLRGGSHISCGDWKLRRVRMAIHARLYGKTVPAQSTGVSSIARRGVSRFSHSNPRSPAL